ncbi:hypothetical protein P8452_49954 [Trifolium repens]|nr:hypothetical protein P8452_49954 [Trifolium repens]
MCCFHLADEMAPKMKRSKLAKMVSEEEKWQPPFQLTTLLVLLDLMCLLNKCQFPIWMTCLPESVAVYKVKSRSRCPIQIIGSSTFLSLLSV